MQPFTDILAYPLERVGSGKKEKNGLFQAEMTIIFLHYGKKRWFPEC